MTQPETSREIVAIRRLSADGIAFVFAQSMVERLAHIPFEQAGRGLELLEKRAGVQLGR